MAVSVLSIGRLRPGGAEYYVGEIATSAEDYYLGHGEAHGRWVGSLAADLGLKGEVDPEHFRRLLEGRHPFTAEQLVAGHRAGVIEPYVSEGPDDWLTTVEASKQLRCTDRYVRRLLRQGALAGEKAVSASTGHVGWRIRRADVNRHAGEHRKPKSRPGYDLTLRPPKSVSILWALGDEHQRAAIRQAHREAVDEVARYFEKQATFARSKGQRVLTNGLVAAAFDHRSSRAGDPLLHTHVVVANLTFTVQDTWRALDGHPLFDHAISGGYLYQAHLRHLLSARLGLRWGPVSNGWAEVVGVSREVIALFSQRRDEIEELLGESGYTSARARQAATLATRQAKDYGVSPDTLAEQWRTRAADIGFDHDAVQACFGHEASTVVEPDRLVTLLDRLGGQYGVTEQMSTFSRRDAIKWLANAAGAAISARQLERAVDGFLASDRVVLLAPTGSHARARFVIGLGGGAVQTAGLALFSTPELLAIEQRVLDVAINGVGYAGPHASSACMTAVLASRPELSTEQRAMVRTVCGSTATIQTIVGRPGSGKTYAAEACAAAYRAAGISVVGCAVSANAAAELQRATGVASFTITGLLNQLQDANIGGLATGTALLVDEASMVGTRDLARLLEQVVHAHGSMKLIGDPDQHGAIDTGGIFRYIANNSDEVVTLVENNRQLDTDERLAIDDYRQGRIAEALARYDDAGNIVRCATAGECYDAMVADWYASTLHGCTDPMIAGPNSTRRALNSRARALLKAEGVLTGRPLVARGREFMVGDQVVARRNDRSLHEPRRRAFVKNGSVGAVTAIDTERRELVVHFAREGTIRLPCGYLDDGHLEHAYARTTYLAQGSTQQIGRYHPSDASRFEEGYVAITRARHQTRIYVVEGELDPADEAGHHAIEPERPSLDTVADAMTRRASKKTAHEVDPLAVDVGAICRTWSATEIRNRLHQLDGVLETCPPSRAAELSHERRALDELRNASTEARSKPWFPRFMHRHTERMAVLEAEQAAHNQFMVDHAPERAARQLLGQAETALGLQARLAVSLEPPKVMERFLGPRPDGTSVRTYDWDRAAEMAMKHLEETGWEPPEGATTIEQILGPRPNEWAARQRYEQIELIYEDVHELDRGAEVGLW